MGRILKTKGEYLTSIIIPSVLGLSLSSNKREKYSIKVEMIHNRKLLQSSLFHFKIRKIRTIKIRI